MTWPEIVRMAVHNLWQRRFRTALNLIGIVIGCVVLLMTAAGAAGVRDAFQALFDASEFAKQIEVYRTHGSRSEPPDGTIIVSGNMSDERRERIRERLVQQWKQKRADRKDHPINAETLAKFAAIEHVQAVVPHSYISCRVELVGADLPISDMAAVSTAAAGMDASGLSSPDLPADEILAGVTGAGPPSNSLRRSVIEGSILEDNDHSGALVHEFLAYQLGFQSDEDLKRLVGRTIRLKWKITGKASSLFEMFSSHAGQIPSDFLAQQTQFTAAFQQLIADLDRTTLSGEQKALLRQAMDASAGQSRALADVVKEKTFTIRGIYRSGAGESLSSLFYQQLMGENVEIQIHRDVAVDWQLAEVKHHDFHSAVLIVDSSRHLREVHDRLEASGWRVFSAVRIMENINWQIDHNQWVVFGVAAAILLTAAIGISNTLIISVMERTPEFGIMKSLGAKDRHLVALMMSEGAMLGLIGGVLAFVLSWSMSFVAQVFVRMYLESEIRGQVTGPLFRFSIPPVLLMLGISVIVCVGASIVPAIRAARLDPVVAMRRT
ncbi:MAG: ABC transporter permease [Planctomycetaceae bacterium]